MNAFALLAALALSSDGTPHMGGGYSPRRRPQTDEERDARMTAAEERRARRRAKRAMHVRRDEMLNPPDRWRALADDELVEDGDEGLDKHLRVVDVVRACPGVTVAEHKANCNLVIIRRRCDPLGEDL